MTDKPLTDFIGKTFIAYSDARTDRAPSVFEGLRVIDKPEGPRLEAIIAFTSDDPATIAQHLEARDIIAEVDSRSAGWAIIDEAAAQGDKEFRDQLDTARKALATIIEARDAAVRFSIELGATAARRNVNAEDAIDKPL